MTDIEIINAAEKKFISEPGIPSYVEPSVERGRERMDKFAEAFIEYSQQAARKEGRELVMLPIHKYPSVFALKKDIEGKEIRVNFGSTQNADDRMVLEIESEKTGADKTSVVLTMISDIDMAVACDDGIYISQLPIRHWCEDLDGRIVMSNKNGMALEYSDGTGLYYIDDVECPQWFFTKPPETVTAQDILGLEDVDQRRIAIERFGVLKFDEVAEVLIDDNEYQLIDLGKAFNSETIESAKYLRMLNPSTNQICMSGVSNDCETIQDALDFRAFGDDFKKSEIHWNPCSLDGFVRNGIQGQVQQGDVLNLAMTKEDFELAIKDLPEIVGRNFVLSPDAQRRHTIDGVRIWGDDETQYIQTISSNKLTHPEHGTETLPIYSKCWAVFERDHVKNITRIEKD